MPQHPNRDAVSRAAKRAGSDTNLANLDIVLEAARSITNAGDENRFLTMAFTGLGNTCAFAIVPGIPRIAMSSSNGTSATTMNLTGTGLEFGFSGTASLKLDGLAGTDGYRVTSKGANNAPEWAEPSVFVQASAPTAVADRRWFKTGDGVLYYYDSTRSKWLSVQEYRVDLTYYGTRAASSGHFLKLAGSANGDVNAAQRTGYVATDSITITGGTWRMKASTSGWRHRVQVYDDSAGTVSNAWDVSPSGTYTTFSDQTLDTDLDEFDLIGASSVNGSASIVNQTLAVKYRRRTS